jgi:hypothetical protein
MGVLHERSMTRSRLNNRLNPFYIDNGTDGHGDSSLFPNGVEGFLIDPGEVVGKSPSRIADRLNDPYIDIYKHLIVKTVSASRGATVAAASSNRRMAEEGSSGKEVGYGRIKEKRNQPS